MSGEQPGWYSPPLLARVRRGKDAERDATSR
jgi:hypothetical protein